MIIPDTNVWIAYFAGLESVVDTLGKVIASGDVGISAIVAAEFLVRARRKEAKAFEELVGLSGLLDVDWDVVCEAVRLRQRVLRRLRRIVMLDCMIAATAKVSGATLWTFDKRDFPFRGVQVLEVGGIR